MKLEQFIKITEGRHAGRYGFVSALPLGKSEDYHYILFGGRCVVGPANVAECVKTGAWLTCRYVVSRTDGIHRQIVAHTDSLEAARMIVRDIPERDQPSKPIFDKHIQQYLENEHA